MAETKKKTGGDPTGRGRFYDEPGQFTTTNSKAFDRRKERLANQFLNAYNAEQKRKSKNGK